MTRRPSLDLLKWREELPSTNHLARQLHVLRSQEAAPPSPPPQQLPPRNSGGGREQTPGEGAMGRRIAHRKEEQEAGGRGRSPYWRPVQPHHVQRRRQDVRPRQEGNG